MHVFPFHGTDVKFGESNEDEERKGALVNYQRAIETYVRNFPITDALSEKFCNSYEFWIESEKNMIRASRENPERY